MNERNDMETIYNKLVRDNIPEIIKANGQIPIVRVLGDDEYRNALNQKLIEEVAEYTENNCIDELCDIIEVAFAIAAANGWSYNDISICRGQKKAKNGEFDKKLFLEKVVVD